MATIVKKEPGESDDKLIAKFRKRVLDSGVLLEWKKRERYTKPSRERYEREKALRRGRRRTYNG
ncbi:30S ribosomal protein S21 [Candidatus Microgenomates bacterium]|nr:30S ribosomal protein S21 [Candidatus Microgenomates bacterium]